MHFNKWKPNDWITLKTVIADILSYLSDIICKVTYSVHTFIKTKNSMYILFYVLKRKTKNNQDECLVAQEKLHPVCAQQVEGPVPTCHSLAEYCREDSGYRYYTFFIAYIFCAMNIYYILFHT